MSTEYTTPPPQPAGPQPHPYLHEPVLYISGLPPYVRDEDLALAFQQCAPFRPIIPRDGSNRPLSGTIEFKYLEKAEKALATLQSRPVPNVQPPVLLVLSPYPATSPPTALPPPQATPRLVKHLPIGYTDSQLYDLFRPFGALASARTQAGFGKDTGVVEFWVEEDARNAEEALHCTEIDGQNIAVQEYQPRRPGAAMGEFSANAPSFVPTGSVFPYPTQYSPPRSTPYHPQRPVFMHGPGQQVQLAPLAGPGSGSHSGLIDPCNLFIKNIDVSIDSNGLFTHFRQFGQIVSARVMRNETGESRGFGFVSYQTPDQASAAMHAMNGMVLGNKQLVVRLHEPKQLRQEKLAQRFGGHNGHPRSSSGATSPTASEAGESYAAGWPSPGSHPAVLGSPLMGHNERPDRTRRSSGSYYHAALAGTLNLPMRYDDLSALSPVVRREVLSGELSRRIKGMGTVSADDLDVVVDSIVALSLSEVVQGIQDPAKLADQVESAKKAVGVYKASSRSKSPSPAASQDSRLLDANALNATASAPDHPSTPLSMPTTLSTPPRTESPSGSVAPTSERDRMEAAVRKLESSQAMELTELLMGLPKRERAMCLFNEEVLRAKVSAAKHVLEADDDEEELSPVTTTVPVPQTPQARKVSTSLEDSPQTPDLSSRGPSATASPTPATPSAPAHTIASLARLPAMEIIKLASSSSATGLPLPKADPLVVKETDKFIDGLKDKPIPQQKQQVGEKLHRAIKAVGIKAPKVTVALLDQEDLRSLAHLMNSYPSVLKEKALLVQATIGK
ncbi:Polyadenylate-binding protein, cytoplasmic and nuclear [Grifola frondosa]|uniref:Polyadenylate-binding protein, cytoplasmic and nuclear n=1 Tax=Grifola frondosa TaxID=5627 RepID=A0A1C7LSW7_GRIFR|nr:Polyadenylate-binding protein, cytoplasmic and nuclear [Grifola frondosa]